jgi:hypothetical protein
MFRQWWEMKGAVQRPGGHAGRGERRNQINPLHEATRLHSAGGNQHKVQT